MDHSLPCRRWLITLAAAALPSIATAIPVTWEASGTLNAIDFDRGLLGEFSSAGVGTPFTVSYTFETDTALTRTIAGEFGGLRYEYLNSAILAATLDVGGAGLDRPRTQSSLLLIRDDFASVTNSPLPADALTDGITFTQSFAPSASTFGSQSSMSLVFRGTLLDLFSGDAIPGDPPPGLLDLELTTLRFFDQACTEGSESEAVSCVSDSLAGTISSVRRVPEPPGLALLALGLATMGVAMKKRRSQRAFDPAPLTR